MVAIILVIAAIAIPNFLHSRMAANEAAAAENVRTITTASLVYDSTWENGYPPQLSTLGGTGMTATCDAAILLDPILSTAPFEKSGYLFAYTGELGNVTTNGAGCGTPGFNGYLISTIPAGPTTGTRSFCSDEPGTIHFNTTGTAITSQSVCEALPVLQ